MSKIPSITFAVSNVTPASSRLGEKKQLDAFSSLLGNGAEIALQEWARTQGRDVPEPAPAVEACSTPQALVVKPTGYHPLVAAVHAAFAEHRPLVLTPDAIWITIVQGLAVHINLNAEKYREFFVSHQGKKTLEVRRDHFKLGSSENSWEDVFTEFSAKIKENIGESNHGLIVADFSTTGAVERAASEVALMDTMQSYFAYYVKSMCGIPSITLEGTLADWESLHAKVKGLYRYPDLEWWLDDVSVFTANCVAAYKGDAASYFWGSLYKENTMSGGPYANGWIIKLFPYIKDRAGPAKTKNPYLGKANYNGSGLTHDKLPNSLSLVPFTWNYFGTEHEYQFIAGIVGVEQASDTLALRPKIGWAVRPMRKSADRKSP